MKTRLSLLSIFTFTFFLSSVFAQDSEILTKLRTLKGISIKKLETTEGFKESFEIMLTQPLDHNNPNSKTFKQRIFLSHINFENPNLLITEGYDANYAATNTYINELSPMLKANQIFVEHRFFGESRPDSMPWKFLTVEQASNDYHAIKELFKQVYTGKWVSTGISKGGETALTYRYFYPEDVVVTVAYVAPINFALEDTREDTFLMNAGDKACREKVFEFQMKLLKNRNIYFPIYKREVESGGDKFISDPEIMYDYQVLEYPFSLFQWGGACDNLPDLNLSPEDIVNSFLTVVSSYYYTEVGIKSMEAFFYQASFELGYYGYDEKPFAKYLKQKDYPNSFFGPKGVDVKFDPKPMELVNKFLQNQGNQIVYIYGGLDPWSASQVKLIGKTDAIKVVKEDGNHATRINNLSNDQKDLVIKALERWLNMKISIE
jgi:hypothetical protein